MFPPQTYIPSDFAYFLATNPHLYDFWNQLTYSPLQPMHHQLAHTNQQEVQYPAINSNFTCNSIVNQNQNLLHETKTLCNKQMSDSYQYNQHQALSSNDDFFQKPFFQDSPCSSQSQQSPLKTSLKPLKTDLWKLDDHDSGNNGDRTLSEFFKTTNPYQRRDSGYQTSPQDSSLEQYDMMGEFNPGFNRSSSVEKYTRPKYLTKEEYEEIRREFEANGHNVIDEDDHTWQQKPPNLDEQSEFPALRLPTENLSDAWKISENLVHKNNRNNQNIFNGWGTKLTKNPFENLCVFCKNNEESAEVYMSHTLKDFDGRTTCPRLRLYTCPICGSNGDNAHTLHYCPKRNTFSLEEQKAKAQSQRNLIKGSRWE